MDVDPDPFYYGLLAGFFLSYLLAFLVEWYRQIRSGP